MSIDIEEISKIGLGAYRMDNSNPVFYEAMNWAVESGCNLIDTAPNYMNGESEKLIGRFLSEKEPSKLFIMSKVGYVDRDDIRKSVWNGKSLEIDDEFHYSLHEDFINYRIDSSLSRIGKPCIDGYLIHNLEHILNSKNPVCSKEETYRQIKSAFELLEEKVDKGFIHYFEVSSNTLPNASSLSLDIDKLVSLAHEVKSNSSFRLIQFPFNVIENEASSAPSKSKISFLDNLKRHGLIGFSNRPFNVKSKKGVLRLAYLSNSEVFDDATLRRIHEDYIGIILEKLKELGMEDEIHEFPIIDYLINNWTKVSNPEFVNSLFKGMIDPFIDTLFKERQKADFNKIHTLFKRCMMYLAVENMNNEIGLIESKLIKKGYINDTKEPLQTRICNYYLSIGIPHILVGMRRVKYVNELSSLF